MTPIRQQYLQLKKRFPDTILFFQLGDFYETFDEDAEIVHRVCEVVLTSRELGRGRRIPMAGVPVHAADHYIAKLLQRGHRVAVCNQLEDPAVTKGLVRRDVVRVVTPGTVVEPNLLEAKANNYLAAIICERPRMEGGSRGRSGRSIGAGLAYVDVTTGEFATTEVPIEALESEIERLGPAEVLISDGDEAGLEPEGLAARVTPLPKSVFAIDTARQALRQHFRVASLEGYGCEELPLATRAAGAIVQYLEETQRSLLPQIGSLVTYSTASYMPIDAQTRRHLELTETRRSGESQGSLLGVLDLTRTAMGGRLLRRWLGQPLLDLEALQARQEAVAALYHDALVRAELTALLDGLSDIERLINRVGAGSAGPRDLLALGRGLGLIPEVRAALERLTSKDLLSANVARLEPQAEIVDLIERAIADDPPAVAGDRSRTSAPAIRSGFSAELDQLRDAAHDARGYLAGLERAERERTGIKSLKVGYNKVFGYYIEVTNANLDQPVTGARSRVAGLMLMPPEGDDGSLGGAGAIEQALDGQDSATGENGQVCACSTNREHLERCLGYVRKQTLVNAERFITSTLKDHETTILTAQDRLAEIEAALFREVCGQVAAVSRAILAAAGALAEIDVYCAFAEAAARYGYIRPVLADDGEIVIRNGRHPVVERLLPTGAFVPNDLAITSPIAGGQARADEKTSRSRAEQAGMASLWADSPDAGQIEHENGEIREVADSDHRDEPAEETGETEVLPTIVMLTGPNMAGKTVYGTSICLIVLMAQIGSFVPADSARIGLVDRIFVRAGAGDDITGGLSTFMVEMAETAYILHHSSERSLIFFDEVGRGTSTYDGMALAQAIVEHIHNHPRLRCKTIFSTHYHELTQLEGVLPGVANFRAAVREDGDQVVFLHQIERGGADRSYGLHVARLAGIPAPVVHRAEAILERLERGPARLPTGRQRGRAARTEADNGERNLQLTLFAEPHPVLREIETLDVMTMTPLEAMTKLLEMQRRIRED